MENFTNDELVSLEGADLYMCKCLTHIAFVTDRVKREMPEVWAGYFMRADNVELAELDQHIDFETHTVADISCISCHEKLGWKFNVKDVSPDVTLVPIKLKMDMLLVKSGDKVVDAMTDIQSKSQSSKMNDMGYAFFQFQSPGIGFVICKLCKTHIAKLDDGKNQPTMLENGVCIQVFGAIVNARISMDDREVSPNQHIHDILCHKCDSRLGWIEIDQQSKCPVAATMFTLNMQKLLITMGHMNFDPVSNIEFPTCIDYFICKNCNAFLALTREFTNTYQYDGFSLSNVKHLNNVVFGDPIQYCNSSHTESTIFCGNCEFGSEALGIRYLSIVPRAVPHPTPSSPSHSAESWDTTSSVASSPHPKENIVIYMNRVLRKYGDMTLEMDTWKSAELNRVDVHFC